MTDNGDRYFESLKYRTWRIGEEGYITICSPEITKFKVQKVYEEDLCVEYGDSKEENIPREAAFKSKEELIKHNIAIWTTILKALENKTSFRSEFIPPQ